MNISSIPSENSELLHPDGPTKHFGMNDFWLLLNPTDRKFFVDQEMAPPLLEINSFLPVLNKLSNVFCLADKSIVSQCYHELRWDDAYTFLSTFGVPSPKPILMRFIATPRGWAHSSSQIHLQGA